MLSWPDFDIMSFGFSYSMNMHLCILGLAFFYSWAVFGTGCYIVRRELLSLIDINSESRTHVFLVQPATTCIRIV